MQPRRRPGRAGRRNVRGRRKDRKSNATSASAVGRSWARHGAERYVRNRAVAVVVNAKRNASKGSLTPSNDPVGQPAWALRAFDVSARYGRDYRPSPRKPRNSMRGRGVRRRVCRPNGVPRRFTARRDVSDGGEIDLSNSVSGHRLPCRNWLTEQGRCEYHVSQRAPRVSKSRRKRWVGRWVSGA
jgi:hypothetical protein